MERLEGYIVPLHKELIEGAQGGNATAQYKLYNLYQKAMFNVALRITGDEMDAEDALQEAFISAFKNIRQYRAEASFGAWLKRIVINKALTLVKKRQYFELEDEEAIEENSYNDLEPVAEANLQVEHIRKMVQLLPDGFRTVLSLYLFEGYDHSEIADIMGITVSTSKSQFNRAKKKLREMINQEAKNG
ncbi:MAG: RNA polymerase sigma factor [Cyclobacteriaceae bacterium]